MTDPLRSSSPDLLREVQGGSEGALDELLVRHLGALEAFVRLKVGPTVRSKESVSDIVQSVCVEVLRAADRFDFRGEGAFRSWLFKQALHKIVNKNAFYSRKRRDAGREELRSLSGVYASLCSPSQVAIGEESREAFEQAFRELPADYQEAFTLHRIVGLSHKEVADEMGRTPDAVRNLVHRALVRLSAAFPS